MIRVVIADDHPIVRAGLRQIIVNEADIEVAGEASSGPELLDRVRHQDFDVVLLDLSMPGMDGLDVLKQLKIERPYLPVIILTIHPESQYALRILKAGASGYLTKESASGELVKALRRVHGGGKYITPSLAEKIAFALDADAGALALSVKTVSTYRTRILEKMHMENNAELIRYAVQNGLVE